MQTCPKCKQLIDDDSWYCDQCGTELKICPSCHVIRRGMTCSQCGTKLITAKDFAQSGGNIKDSTTPPVCNNQDTNPIPSVTPTQPIQDVNTDCTMRPGVIPQPQPQPQPQIKPGHLVCQNPPIRLGIGDGAIIGRRGSYAQVFAGQGYVSGTHARLQYSPNGQFEIVDLGSTNGTFVNGQQLAPNKPQVVNIGDIVKFANLEFMVQS